METSFLLLEKHLPTEKFYNVICHSDDNNYTIRSNLLTLKDIKEWVHRFGLNSNTKWNSRHSIPMGKNCICMKRFVCHHSEFNKQPSHLNKRGLSKNAKCPAKLYVKVKLVTSRTIRNDPYLKDGLCAVIRISKIHSHTLNSAQALRFLNCEKRNVFEEYFKDGMTVAEAKVYHESVLLQKNCVTEKEFANARVNPTRRTVSYWYDKWRKANSGPRSILELIEKLKEKQNTYSVENTTVVFEEDPFCVVILTPIIKRAHDLPMASKLVFLNTTSSYDLQHHSVTFLFTPCAAGCAPLGVLITKGQNTESYATAFKLLRMNCSNAFGHEGYPKVFLADYSIAEINALQLVWPESNSLFCIFHILREVCKWLWDRKQKVKKEHRIELLNSFKKVVFAENISSMEDMYHKCLECGNKYLYPQWKHHLSSYYWPMRDKWALAYRDALFRNYQTNYFTKSCIQFFKDVVLSRVKPHCVVSLIDYCCTILENSYAINFRDFADFCQEDSYQFFKNIFKQIGNIKKEQITELSPASIYLVPSEKDDSILYTVDVAVGFCSCLETKFGKLCKHQYAVLQNVMIFVDHFPRITAADRQCIENLAFGVDCLSTSIYENFLKPNVILETEIFFSDDDVAEEKKDVILDDEITINSADILENEKDEDEIVVSLFEVLTEKVPQNQSSKKVQLFNSQSNNISSKDSVDFF